MPLETGVEASQPQGDGKTPEDLWKIARWVSEVTLYDRETQVWYERGKRILRRYKDERSPREDNVNRYNVLWANTQTCLPALFARNPKPDFQRRFKDADPVGRVTADVLERCTSYFTDTDAFYAANRQCTIDYLLPGRGTVWVRYVPHMKEVAIPMEISQTVQEGEDQKPQTQEVIDYEEVLTDYVHPQDFGHNICRTWDEVYCGWRIVYMTRDELVKRFGEEKGRDVPLDYVPSSLNDTKLDDGIGKATIYELWDKNRRVAVWFHKTIPDALDLREDPLRLDGFFPFPKPILTNLCNDSVIPTPIYTEYQDQAMELDSLTARICAVERCLKVAGVYDASVQGLGRVLSEGVDATMIPVESWAMFAEKGGIQGAMSFLPIKEIAAALMQMYQARDQVKKDLMEITGIPDIVRGDSNPNETLGAQQIKTSFATNRISDQQRDIQRFVRETIRIIVNVMCNHFQLSTIKEISGVRLLTEAEKAQVKQAIAQYQQVSQQAKAANQPPPPPPLPKGMDEDQLQQLLADPSWEDVDAMLRNNAMRCFRIDIETDSTIKADQEADKASRIEFLKAVGGFLEQAGQAGAAQPEMVPVLGQMLMFAVRGFPVGKELEGALTTAIQKLEKIAENPPPKQSPEMMKVQGEQQLAQQKMQSDTQMEQAKFQAEQQLNQAKVQGEIAVQHAKVQADAQTAQAQQQAQAQQAFQQNQLEAERESRKLQQEMQLAQIRIAAETDMQLKKAHIMAAASIEVARIGAKADDGAQAEAREASGE